MNRLPTCDPGRVRVSQRKAGMVGVHQSRKEGGRKGISEGCMRWETLYLESPCAIITFQGEARTGGSG
jgi:hypothetical protein